MEKDNTTIIETAKDILLDLFERMLGDANDVKLGEYLYKNHIVINIISDTYSSLIIGQQGENIIAIELMLNQILKTKLGDWQDVRIDVGYYRQKRVKSLEKLARDVVSKVRVLQKPIRLDPMPSFDRKVIHEIVSEFEDLETYSEGPQKDRRLIVTTR